MQDQYVEIPEFPDYMVSREGIVINMRRGAEELKPRPNQYGLIRVGLSKDGRQFNRSLSLLVATAFVQPEREDFNTVIHLNGDHYDCRADNLAWRPRWFAIAYHKQFEREWIHLNKDRILCRDTNVVYDSPKDAVIEKGILYGDILLSFTNDSYTFPTMEQWSYIGD